MKRMRVIGYSCQQQRPATVEQRADRLCAHGAERLYYDGDTPAMTRTANALTSYPPRLCEKAVSGMVVAPQSVITEYMVEHGFKMKSVEGGSSSG